MKNLIITYLPKKSLSLENGPVLDRKRTDYAPARLFAVITMFLMLYSVGIESTWATPKATYTWTASPATDKDKFSSTSGNATLGSYTWAYTQGTARTNYSSSNPTGYIQLGAKNNSVGAFTLTLTNTDPIKSVTVNCASYSASSNISITIGGTSYLSSTATTSWNQTTGGGDSGGSVLATPLTGNVQISFTASSRALYIKSITIVYGEAGPSCATAPTVGAPSNSSFLLTHFFLTLEAYWTNLGLISEAYRIIPPLIYTMYISRDFKLSTFI